MEFDIESVYEIREMIPGSFRHVRTSQKFIHGPVKGYAKAYEIARILNRDTSKLFTVWVIGTSFKNSNMYAKIDGSMHKLSA